MPQVHTWEMMFILPELWRPPWRKEHRGRRLPPPPLPSTSQRRDWWAEDNLPTEKLPSILKWRKIFPTSTSSCIVQAEDLAKSSISLPDTHWTSYIVSETPFSCLLLLSVEKKCKDAPQLKNPPTHSGDCALWLLAGSNTELAGGEFLMTPHPPPTWAFLWWIILIICNKKQHRQNWRFSARWYWLFAMATKQKTANFCSQRRRYWFTF